jgi:hypothetical protein
MTPELLREVSSFIHMAIVFGWVYMVVKALAIIILAIKGEDE